MTQTTGVGIVNADWLNMRSSPGGRILTILKGGTEVKIVGRTGGWLNIWHGGLRGSVASRYISVQPQVEVLLPGDDDSESQEEADVQPIYERQGEVAASLLNFRDSPNGHILGRLERGKIVRIVSEANGWMTVEVDGRQLCLLEAVSENEGRLEAINTYDNAFLSFGIFQWTVGVGSEAGELPSLLDRLQKRCPDSYQKYFGQHSLEISGVREVSGNPARGYFKIGGRVIATPEDKKLFRTMVWPYRFKIAGMDDDVRLIQLEHALSRIDCFFRVDNRRVRGHYIGEYVTSEYGVAQLLDQHTNRPAHVIQTVRKAVDSLEDELNVDDPSGWGDTEERRLIKTYLKFREHTSMTDGPIRARRIRRQLELGIISDSRGSFQVGQ